MCERSNDSMADARGHLLHASAKETKGKWDSLLCKVCYSAQGSVTALGRGVVKRQPYAPLRATTLCAFPIRFDYADLTERSHGASARPYGSEFARTCMCVMIDFFLCALQSAGRKWRLLRLLLINQSLQRHLLLGSILLTFMGYKFVTWLNSASQPLKL